MNQEEANNLCKWPVLGRAGSGVSIVRIQMVREGSFPYSPNPVRNSSNVARIFRSYLAGVDREYFVVLLLDAKHRVNTLEVLGIPACRQAGRCWITSSLVKVNTSALPTGG